MADKKEERRRNCYNEIRKFIDAESYHKIVKTCNKILAENISDSKAWQCKMNVYIKLGNFSEALQSLNTCQDFEPILFEKAYCEYRVNDCATAYETLGLIKDTKSAKFKELLAQILYRMERYDESFMIYRDLFKNVSDSYDEERLVNLIAVGVNKSFNGSTDKVPDVASEDSYNQLYNKACGLVATKELGKALQILRDARKLAIKSLQEEGATEDEINKDLVSFRVQEAYCLQCMGQEKEAMAIYNSVLKVKPDDPSVIAIISNNIVAINKEGNVFDSKKRVKATQGHDLEHKLTSKQKATISLNNCLLAYYTSQENVFASELAKLKKIPSLSLSVTIIEAAKFAQNGSKKEAIQILSNHAKTNPSDAMKALIAAVQIALEQGDIQESIYLLTSLKSTEKFRLGILSALMVLCPRSGHPDNIKEMLLDAIQWHKNSKLSEERLSVLCKKVADYFTAYGAEKACAAALEELRSLEPDDAAVLAQLISAYSQFDTDKAKSLSKYLPSSNEIVGRFDVESLVVSAGSKYIKKTLMKSADDEDGSAKDNGKLEKKTKKKRKRIILPKKMVEGAKPDPDRWLPRWQRQNVRKRKDKRYKEAHGVGKGTQGVSSEAADQFDITKNPSEHKATGTTRPPPAWSKKNAPKNKKGKKKGK